MEQGIFLAEQGIFQQRSNHPFRTAGVTDCVCAPRGASSDIPFQGDSLLVVGVMDPEAAVLWIHLVNQVHRSCSFSPSISAARLMVNAKADAAISGSAGDRQRVAPIPRQ